MRPMAELVTVWIVCACEVQRLYRWWQVKVVVKREMRMIFVNPRIDNCPNNPVAKRAERGTSSVGLYGTNRLGDKGPDRKVRPDSVNRPMCRGLAYVFGCS